MKNLNEMTNGQLQGYRLKIAAEFGYEINDTLLEYAEKLIASSPIPPVNIGWLAVEANEANTYIIQNGLKEKAIAYFDEILKGVKK